MNETTASAARQAEANNRHAVTSGIEAAQVLDNPAFRSAMDALKADVIATWKAAPIRDTEGQRILLQLAKLADKFEAILVGRIEAGKFANSKIEIDDLRADNATRRLLRKVL